MDVNIFNYDEKIDLVLMAKIKRLPQIMKIDCVVNVHFLNGKYSLLRWASNHKFNKNALNIFILDKGMYFFALQAMKGMRAIILNRDHDRVENVDRIVKFILDKDNDECEFDSEKQVLLTESDVQTLFDMFMSNQSLGKTRWNAKKRVKQKLGFKDDHEMYIWWRLVETLPAEIIRKQIKLTSH